MKVAQAPNSAMVIHVFSNGGIMNFNHLLTERENKQACRNKTYKMCKWKPVSEGRATAASQVHFDMVCDTCGCRTTKFMHFKEYDIHEKVIKQEINNV
jgi:hypothetical protein